MEATGGPVLPSASRSPPAATEDRRGRGPEGDEGEKDREAQRPGGAAPHTHLPCVTRGRSLTGVKTSWAPDVMLNILSLSARAPERFPSGRSLARAVVPLTTAVVLLPPAVPPSGLAVPIFADRPVTPPSGFGGNLGGYSFSVFAFQRVQSGCPITNRSRAVSRFRAVILPSRDVPLEQRSKRSQSGSVENTGLQLDRTVNFPPTPLLHPLAPRLTESRGCNSPAETFCS